MKCTYLDFTNSINNDKLHDVAKSLVEGNLAIFPTDTVYGIGCDALNVNALKKLYEVKKRNYNKPINILISDINMIYKFTKNINNIHKKLIENFWPGCLTIIFDKSELVPDLLTSNLDTIGLRMPGNKVCLDLINSFGSAIATSSANISEEYPSISITDNLINTFNKQVSFIINGGPTKLCVPSTIVKVENNEIIILRKGSITKSDIIKCFGGNINVR